MDRVVYKDLCSQLVKEVQAFYGPRLVTFAIFGSYARNDLRNDSDLDILIIAKELPRGRMHRTAQFLGIEKKLAPVLEDLAKSGYHPYLSPIFKTPEEALSGSPLFLDMTQEVEILFDHERFFLRRLHALKERLKELGSKRVWVGKMWYWVLKPDLKPGEIFTL